MNWLRSVTNWLFPPDIAKPRSADELREQAELNDENKRHIEAIEHHVKTVTNRVRADAAQADRRVRGR